MKKAIIIIVCILIVLGLGFFVFHTSSNNNVDNISNQDKKILNDIASSDIPNNIAKAPVIKESELASFSTDLQGDEARLTNIKVTCDAINGKEIKPGETFSFNNIVGQPTKEKGYMEADVIVDTHVEKGFGGGNCQVSTTIYNACLYVNDIEIVERNPHKKSVYYIEEGKDASVSYSGNLDFKFKNNSINTVKLYVNSEDNKVTARIVNIYS